MPNKCTGTMPESGAAGWCPYAGSTKTTWPRRTDCVTVEAALEVRLHGEPFAVVMRTPGADRELTSGFLFTEGPSLRSKEDLARIDLLAENIADVRLDRGPRARQVPVIPRESPAAGDNERLVRDVRPAP